MAVTVLTSTSESERAETLHKWIQIAIDVKTALGNLFGFSAIMLGLCLPQVNVNLSLSSRNDYHGQKLKELFKKKKN